MDHPDVVGLTIGTWLDCIDEEKIKMVDKFAQEPFVSLEFGVESIYNETLRSVNSRHDYAAFLQAITLPKGHSSHLGAHSITRVPLGNTMPVAIDGG